MAEYFGIKAKGLRRDGGVIELAETKKYTKEEMREMTKKALKDMMKHLRTDCHWGEPAPYDEEAENAKIDKKVDEYYDKQEW